MRMIVAKRRNVIRRFTEIAWKNLGANKNGWVEVQDQQVTNSTQKPEMKQGKEVEVPVAKVVKKEEEGVVESSEPTKQGKLSVDEKKSFVEKHLSPFDKSSMKDFLDSVNVEYSKKETEEALRVKIAEYVEYKEEKLKQYLG